MPALDSSLKVVALTALVTAGSAVFAQGGAQLGTDPWYGGQSNGFWGLGDSVGVRGTLPGTFSPPGTSSESLNAFRQFGGYRISNAFAIEGSQTQFGNNASGCNYDRGAIDAANHACYGAAWSLSGVATLPFQSGLSLYGRLGLHYWQRGLQEDAGHRNADEPGSLGKVYGIGLSYGLSKSITVHAESEHYSELTGNNPYGPSGGIGLDSSVHSIGLSFKF
jgi:hypothetical protein